MVFAICAALRLARFNVQIEDPNRPAWAGNFFTGVPAPAGAITVLLPIYLFFLQVPMRETALLVVALIYTFVVAGLMVSRLPVLSGKKMGTRVRPDMVAPVILLVVLFIALLVSYPWHVLSVGTTRLSRLAAARLGLLPAPSARGCGCRRRGARGRRRAGIPAPPAAPAGDDRPVRLN